MIALEDLFDGSPTARNFKTLKQVVLDTGGITAGIRWGTFTFTWPNSTDSGGPRQVTHGLGKAPVLAAVFNADTAASYAGIASYTCVALTATTFDFYGRAPGAVNASKTVYWVVIG